MDLPVRRQDGRDSSGGNLMAAVWVGVGISKAGEILIGSLGETREEVLCKSVLRLNDTCTVCGVFLLSNWTGDIFSRWLIENGIPKEDAPKIVRAFGRELTKLLD